MDVRDIRPAVAGRATKMAITWSRGPQTCGTFDRRMRNFALRFCLSQNLLKMHAAPGNCDFLHLPEDCPGRTSLGVGAHRWNCAEAKGLAAPLYSAV